MKTTEKAWQNLVSFVVTHTADRIDTVERTQRN